MGFLSLADTSACFSDIGSVESANAWLHNDAKIGATEAEACFSNEDGTGSSEQCWEGAVASNLAASSMVTVLSTDSCVNEVERQLMVGGSESAIEACMFRTSDVK